MPMNPVVRPPIEQATARKFRNGVDSTKLMIIRKGSTAPMTSKAKPITTNLKGCSIGPLYL